ncbi:putative pectinesterase inhibitor domain-containing protein [Rosa chinensis]|uniref:Putative pectinesterase inhibitor domain-containing protein n=1 Tax=Rosa chinensis TaxID=74649 RepID=A0A2P6R7M7_ROSCH|nr:uncharacterized protein LOC112194016 [Rosa chinensis]PRQ42444.1 putative pectinesterase inhibitor domain-containing protein [Rosa chinensis]
MAFASKLVLVSLLLVVFLMINIKPSLSQSTQQLIEKICRSTEDYGFCRRTFEAHLKSPNANIVDLTQITLEVATDHATKTHEFIRQTLETTRDPALKNALSECENAYGLIMHAFELAVVSFFFGDYKNIEKEERITPRTEASCEASLYTPPNKQKHILDERSREMRIFIGMSLVSAQELVRSKLKSAPVPAPAPLFVTSPSKASVFH